MAGKRTGPPYKRSGKWGAAVNFKGKKHWVGSFETPEAWRLAAAEKLVELKKAAENPATPTSSKTVREYVEEDGWPIIADKRLKTTTVETYLENIRPFLREFGDRPLDRGISRKEANAWKAAHPSASRVLVTFFNDARIDDLTEVNPFDRLKYTPGRGRRGIRVLTIDEFVRLADVARRSRADDYGQVLEAVVTWQGTVGTRNGETFAVEWSHIDFERNRVEIVQRFDSKGRLGPPKNGKERTVVLTPPAKELILKMPRLHERFVFATVTGRPFRQSSWGYYWHPVRAAFTALLPDSHWLPRRTAENSKDPLAFYELRHRAATWLCEPPPRGLGLSDFDTSIQLGHTDGGALVRQVYSHRDENAALERIDGAMQSVIEAEGDEW